MIEHGWVITKDHFAQGDEEKDGNNMNAVGMVGPRDATLSSEEIKKHVNRVHFKMYTDDNDLVYEGFNVEWDGDADSATEEEADEGWRRVTPGFEPLEHFGAPNFGCTFIKLRGKDGSYETL
jgi:hypothetical protein